MSWLQLPFAVIGAQESKICHSFHFVPFYLLWNDGTAMLWNAIILLIVLWMLSFKPAFSFSSFTLINRYFSSSSLSANRVRSSAYLRLLIFLLAIQLVIHPAWQAFHMMCFANKLKSRVTIPSLIVLLSNFEPVSMIHIYY